MTMLDELLNSFVAQKRMKLAGLDAALLADATRMNDILDIILFEEIGHVAVGNHWYRWLCEREGLDPIAHYKKLAIEFGAPRLKPPLNMAARLKPGGRLFLSTPFCGYKAMSPEDLFEEVTQLVDEDQLPPPTSTPANTPPANTQDTTFGR